MRTVSLLTLAIFLSGCGATTQIAHVQQTQHQQQGCRLVVNYNCPEPVAGQPYSCAPTVSENCSGE